MLVPISNYRVKYLPLVPPPPEAVDDFVNIARFSMLKKPVELGWTMNQTYDYYWPFDEWPLRLFSILHFQQQVCGFTISARPPARFNTRVVGSICGIDKVSRTLMWHGVPKQEADVITRRHILAHEIGHVRQFERYDFPCRHNRAIERARREQEAEDWSHIVFSQLWPEHLHLQEFLTQRFHQASAFSPLKPQAWR